MSGKVVALRGVRLPNREGPDAGVVGVCEDLLERARSGQLRSLLATGFTDEKLRVGVFAGDLTGDVYSTLGALAWLQHEYVAHITGESDDGLRSA